MSWWIDLGYPPFEAGEDGFPQTGQVVKYYRENKRDDGRVCTQNQVASILGISPKTIGEIENRDASLDFDRRQRLCQYLDIPPILLGIRTCEEIGLIIEERRAEKGISVISTAVNLPKLWWRELDYLEEFGQGHDGFFPRTGQVVKHYRRRAVDKDGKPWSQRRLADALGIETNQAVWNLENRDTELDIERRRFLSDLFDIPPLLLGIITLDEIDKLVEQRRATKSGIIVISTPPAVSHKLTVDVQEYESLLESYWKTFIGNPTQISMTNISLCIDTLDRELPHVRKKQPIRKLLCRFHDLVANILIDQQKYDEAMAHLEKALQFAELVNDDELKAAVLYDYGNALWNTDRLDEALKKYEAARRYEQNLPSNLRGSLLLEAGSTGTLVAETQEKKDEAILLVNQVGNIVRSNRKEEDPYFLDLNLDRYHLTHSFSLIAVGRNTEAIDELKLVKGGPEYPRRQANKDIFQAQALTNLGKYSEAADFAASGLVIVQEANSVRNIATVERMYKQFPRGLLKHDEHVARLGYLLSKRKKRSKR